MSLVVTKKKNSMKSKMIKIYATILLVLLGVIVLPWLMRDQATSQEYIQNVPFNLSQFTSENISQINVKNKSQEYVLQKNGDAWHIVAQIISEAVEDGQEEQGESIDEQADKKKIETLFESFTQTTARELVARTVQSHKNFEVSDNASFTIEIAEGTINHRFIIGKTGSGTNTFYLRKADADQVYLMSGSLRTILETKIENWQQSSDEESDDATQNQENMSKVEQ